MHKLAILLMAAVVAAAAASAHPQYGAYDSSAYTFPPRPFRYAFGVKDPFSGTDFDKTESQDRAGNVEGQYRVVLPDGRTQIITYHADHYNGNVVDIEYVGRPTYPEHGYGYKTRSGHGASLRRAAPARPVQWWDPNHFYATW